MTCNQRVFSLREVELIIKFFSVGMLKKHAKEYADFFAKFTLLRLHYAWFMTEKNKAQRGNNTGSQM